MWRGEDIYKGRTQLHLEMVQEIKRIKTGIEGLDKLVGGGIPEKFSVLVSGSPGTGKSILGLQFLCYGASAGENGVYVTFAEPRDSIIVAGERLNLGPAALEKEGKLNIIEYFEIGNEEDLERMSKIRKEIDEIEEKKKGEYSKDRDAVELADNTIVEKKKQLADLSEVMQKERHGAATQQREAHFFELLESMVKEKNVKRLVLDSISEHMIYDGDRASLHTFIRRIRDLGTTVLLISEASEDDKSIEKTAEYLVDGVIVMHYVGIGGSESMSLQVKKMRWSSQEKGFVPYEITKEGIKAKPEEAQSILME